MATVVPRLKKRRLSPHVAASDGTSPSTSQFGVGMDMTSASYMPQPLSSPPTLFDAATSAGYAYYPANAAVTVAPSSSDLHSNVLTAYPALPASSAPFFDAGMQPDPHSMVPATSAITAPQLMSPSMAMSLPHQESEPFTHSAPASSHSASVMDASASLPIRPQPRTRMCVHEMINGREQPVIVVSDDEDNDAPPASPLLRHSGSSSSRRMSSFAHAGSKRKSYVPWEGGDVPPKRRRQNDDIEHYHVPMATTMPSESLVPTLPPLPSLPTIGPVTSPVAAAAAAVGAPPPSVSTPVHSPFAVPDVPAYYKPACHDSWRMSRFAQPGTPRTNFSAPLDDKDGHIIVREGEFITPRYQIRSLLGQGTFGKVVQCYDRKLCQHVAIKVIRAVQKYRDASQIEIRVLNCLRQNDPLNRYQCVQFLESFDFRNHVCIVSDLLDCSVFDFLKENKFQPFPCRDIWLFAKQLMRSVAYLHRLSLIHTDLKPENVLLVDSSFDLVSTSRRSNARKKRVLRNAEIRLIDFGSATFSNEYHSGVVSTRHYRAPEIILGMGWSFPCDVWSIGCILVEFFTGEALFQTHDNLEHLAMMEMVLGKLPDDYRRKAETYKPEYFYHGRLDYPRPDTTKQSRRFVQSMKPLQDIITGPSAYAKHQREFVSLLRRLLEFDPAKRITVEEALKHPYFQLDAHDFPP